jgi:hypothetical protein
MSVQIGLSNGSKWVVEGEFEATVNAMSGPGNMFTVEGGRGRRIYIFRDQIAYVLEEGPGSVYEERGVVSAGD